MRAGCPRHQADGTRANATAECICPPAAETEAVEAWTDLDVTYPSHGGEIIASVADAEAVARVKAVLDACDQRLERSPDRVLAFWVREVRDALTLPGSQGGA